MNLSCIWSELNNEDRKDLVTILYFYNHQHKTQTRRIVNEMYYSMSYERLIFFDIKLIHNSLLSNTLIAPINKNISRLTVLINKAITDN